MFNTDNPQIILETPVHGAGGPHRLLRGREAAHDFVANGFNHHAALIAGFGRKHLQRSRYQLPGLEIALLFK
jgi:hypothetical protein